MEVCTMGLKDDVTGKAKEAEGKLAGIGANLRVIKGVNVDARSGDIARRRRRP
jgi:uncharacterized protein YjbJ (UPF0337 family)